MPCCLPSLGLCGRDDRLDHRRSRSGRSALFTRISARASILFEKLLAQVRFRMITDVREAIRGSQTFIELEYPSFLAFFDHLYRNPWYIPVESEASVRRKARR